MLLSLLLLLLLLSIFTVVLLPTTDRWKRSMNECMSSWSLSLSTVALVPPRFNQIAEKEKNDNAQKTLDDRSHDAPAGAHWFFKSRSKELRRGSCGRDKKKITIIIL